MIKYIKLTTFLFFFFLFSSCLSTKEWTDDQYLLKQPQIVGLKKAPYDKLYYYTIRQKPNRRFLWIPIYAGVYQKASKKFKPEVIKNKIEKIKNEYNEKILEAEINKETKKADKLLKKRNKKITKYETILQEGNWWMRVVGEKPVFLDTAITKKAAAEITEFLRKEQGFFQGKATAEIQYLPRKRARVIFKIQENEQTLFGTTNYLTKDSTINSLLNAHKKYTEIKENDPYSKEKIDAERRRITDLLRENGYLFFTQQYVNFKVDTLHFNKKMDSLRLKTATDSLIYLHSKDKVRRAYITVVINEPLKGTHKRWQVNQVNAYILHENKKIQKKEISNPDTLISPRTNIMYVDRNQRIKYSTKVLDQRIKVTPKSIFNQSNEATTQRLLAGMDIFKYITLREDTTGGKLTTNIFLTPLERYQFSNEIGFNVLQGLPGPFVNFAYKNRNIFGGCEVLETNLRFTIDGQTGFLQERQLYTNQEVGLNTSLNFPKILLLSAFLPKKLRSKLENFNPTTRVSLGYNFIRRPEYTRQNLTAAITYRGQSKNATYNFTFSELSLVNTNSIRDDFRQLLLNLESQGVPIIQSFDRALVSSIYFIYTFNNNTGNENKPSHLIRVLGETGGNVFDFMARNSKIFEEGKIFGLKYFQYWKLNTTFTYNLPLLKPNHMLAFRANLGIANSFGGSRTLPYEKFFFAGGGSSLRAWRPRSLGPGEYTPLLNADGNFNYIEQPGEIILEGNIEYRFPVFSFLRWAFFVDVGNIWSIQPDLNRTGAQFQSARFLEQMAIGSGMGLRMNFPFLLLRFDFGVKVYDPARSFEKRWVIEQFNFADSFRKELVVLNLGIGYPF